jgi:hypothetical protein
MSLVNQQMQLWNWAPLLKSTSFEGFKRGTTLFQWSWKCMTHAGVIWIVSSRSVLVFSMIDNWEVIYLYFCIQIFKQRVSIVSNLL